MSFGKENLRFCFFSVDIYRRIVDLHEREYLKSQNVVTETQCDLGLTALKLDEVLELMSTDYPEKCHVQQNVFFITTNIVISLFSSNSTMSGNKNVVHLLQPIPMVPSLPIYLLLLLIHNQLILLIMEIRRVFP